MCCCNEGKKGCRKPENLKGEPQDCSKEQVRQCHGDAKTHCCTSKGNRGHEESGA